MSKREIIFCAALAYVGERTEIQKPSIDTESALPLKHNEVKDELRNRDMLGIYKNGADYGPGPRLMGANTLIGDAVFNLQEDHLGDIKEIMLDVPNGKIAYAVLSFGGVFTIGEKLFAVPWSALHLDPKNKRFTMDMAKARFDNAPGFNSDHWPNMADETWINEMHTYYHPT